LLSPALAAAATCSPQALELFRNVLTASCSIPGVFEPARITVEANGRQFEELHVDGGVPGMSSPFPAPC